MNYLTVDASLNEFTLPNIQSLRQNIGFGTTVVHNDGSLTVTEFANDVAMPFTSQWMKEISGNSKTTIVEKNCGFYFTNSEKVLDVDFASKPGLIVNITNLTGVKENTVRFITRREAVKKSDSPEVDYYNEEYEVIPLKPGMTITIISVGSNFSSSRYGWRLSSLEYNGSKINARNAEGDLFYSRKRWLRFVAGDGNHRKLKIAAGTYLNFDNKRTENRLFENEAKTVNITEKQWLCATSDMVFDVEGDSGTTFQNGHDYGVYLTSDNTFQNDEIESWGTKLVAVDLENEVNGNYRKIGRFHTLCADAGSDLTAKVPYDKNETGGIPVPSNYLIAPYSKVEDKDFYDFYNVAVTNSSDTSSSTNNPYTFLMVNHPLKGYVAGDILPESIWCLSFKPDCVFEDAMCYNKYFDSANDVYLTSGNGTRTRSAYGKPASRSRTYYNFQEDLRIVGKRPLTDKEFTAAAIGSNEQSVINGANDTGASSVGGHSDTKGVRMISAIGLEECCGLLWQILDEVSATGGNGFVTTDGRALFGQEYGAPHVLIAGGSWHSGVSCGSRCRASDPVRSDSSAYYGLRGSCSVSRND